MQFILYHKQDVQEIHLGHYQKVFKCTLPKRRMKWNTNSQAAPDNRKHYDYVAEPLPAAS